MNTPKRSETFAALVAKQPDNELFRFSLAQALVAEHRLVDAAEQYKFCVAKKSDWMMPRIHLGKLYLELGRKSEARLILDEALKLAVEQEHEEPEKELRALIADIR
jgi:predicted Zn-dependent protease